MTPAEREILFDMKAFIEFSIADNARFGMVLSTIGHDCGGILKEERFFSPRTSGYFKSLQRLRERDPAKWGGPLSKKRTTKSGEHVFSEATDTCIKCGISSSDDALENKPCPN